LFKGLFSVKSTPERISFRMCKKFVDGETVMSSVLRVMITRLFYLYIFCIALSGLLLISCTVSSQSGSQENRKKIVLIAGPASHGYGFHEHNAGCLLLAKLLNENMSSAVFAKAYLNGWPKEPNAFDNADAVVVFSDGGPDNIVMGHLEEFDKLVKKDIGIAFLHYAVEVPTGEPGKYMLNWIGGYFETFWSVNPTYEAKFEKLPEHPITRGVKPFSLLDEWYFHIRFVEDFNSIKPALITIPPDIAHREGNDAHSANPIVRARIGMPEVVAWVYERPAGGRGFGFTGGHYHWNWASDSYRKLVLNALVWIAGAEVPPDGVLSKTPTVEELEANIDEPNGNWNKEGLQRRIEQWNRK
jgi:hypothetical protein